MSEEKRRERITGQMDLSHKIVFVGGLHRSGTSLLHESLRSHPDVSGFADTGVWEDEGQHLQSVMPTARAHGGPGRFAFDPAAHLTEDSPIATPECAWQLFTEWAQYWQADSAWWVEKSPPNLIRGRYLQHLFPEARFVMVLRHPVETALATRRWPDSPQRLQVQLAHWFRAYDLMSSDLPHLRHVCIVRYEDFCRDPGEVLAGLSSFLDIGDRFERPTIDPGATARYAGMWQQMRRSPKGLVRTTMLARRYAARARAFGYDMDRFQ